MTSATLDEHVAMLNAVNLKPGEAAEFALDLAASENEDRYYRASNTAKQLGFNPAAMDDAHRYTVAAAALLIAAEDAQLSPFDRWLRKNIARAEFDTYTARDLALLRRGFEGGCNG